jgi:hypothetical protein
MPYGYILGFNTDKKTLRRSGISASVVLKAHTKKNGLSALIQLTSEKLNIRINTPAILMNRMLV